MNIRPVTDKSLYLRLKERLPNSNKVLLIDKYGELKSNDFFYIYCGIINQLKNVIKKGNICLFSPFARKEVFAICCAVVSLGGIVIFGNPKISLSDCLKSIEKRSHADVLIYFEEDSWHYKIDNNVGKIDMRGSSILTEPSLLAEKDKPSIFVFTSGSTGNNEIVAISEYSFINHIEREGIDLGPNHTVSYGCLPLNHAFGLGFYVQHILLNETVFISDTRRPDYALEIIEKYSCSSIANVPTFFMMLIDAQKLSNRNISSLKYGAIAGSPYTKEQFIYIEKELGITLCSTYGMTEASTVITSAPYYVDIEERCSGVGKPFDQVTVVLKDNKGSVVPDIGEICFKGYNLMLGYVSKNGMNLPLDEEGFFHTGDIGEIDEKGNFHIVDRKKNIFIRGGENFSCHSIEKKILKMQGIKDVCVVGVPDKKYGEVAGAMIVSERILDSKMFTEEASAILNKGENPVYVIIVNSIPLLENGKPDKQTVKRKIIEKYAI